MYNNKPKKVEGEKKLQYDTWRKEAELQREENSSNGKKGSLICRNMSHTVDPTPEPGYLMVFPNYKHGGRADGIGYPDLSPMRLGPVEHGQPGVVQCLNIENYHQFNKCYSWEYDNKSGQILDVFFKRRDQAYRDSTPHRHKFDKQFIDNQVQIDPSALRTPLFTVHLDSEGGQRRYNYQQCRWFYCHQYEILASKTESFADLKQKVEEGYNIQIMGYDARHVDNISQAYLDTRYPFGHELVLLAMLTIDDPSQYPWNVYYEKNKHIYV
eukprot:TRINITY_DN1835_c0_g1_i1.p1 TRINITY_DN1835_c0_g1~~TRINITY_DN1835_c0_g1_i1.p1  ORF type:complete len:269 (-),score=39.59 TRINITY_DN1835_c0_g1_i1:39-845(-)